MNSPKKNRTKVTANVKIFSELFREGKFEVPWHQRKYDWKKEHISELLHDLREAFEEKRECYFLGAIMLVAKKETSIWEINDGQQRMVTYSLICARLCYLFEERSDYRSRALRILFDLDATSSVEGLQENQCTPRLTPPAKDKTRYHLMIRGESIGANGKLTDAWRTIDDFIFGMGEDRAKKFFDFLIQKVEVACLYIPDNVDPNAVYETINCRGKHLEDFDLLRNYLYSYFNVEDEKQRRETVHENLERIHDQLRRSEHSTEYARCYFQCKFGFLPKTRFYRESRKKIRDMVNGKNEPANDIYELISDFSREESIELFHLMIKPDVNPGFIQEFKRASATSRSNRNLFAFLQELKNYTITSPVVFALLRRYQDINASKRKATDKRKLAKHIHKSIKYMNSFTMRVAFASPKFESSDYESEFSDLAKRVMSTRSLFDIDILESLHECDNKFSVISDGKFIAKMKIATIADVKRAKLFLSGVNSHIQSDADVIDANQCTIEHTLPKSEEHWSGWEEFDNDTAKDYIHRLGNLTLLGKNDNKPGASDNKNFSAKKHIFKRSAIKLSQEVSTKLTWSPEIIDRRQSRLAKIASEVWCF